MLEPKKGLYDKFVLLLDFNSLYPSIIQEYNICFTTVSQPQDGSLPPLPTTGGTVNDLALLPKVIRQLVQRRRQVSPWTLISGLGLDCCAASVPRGLVCCRCPWCQRTCMSTILVSGSWRHIAGRTFRSTHGYILALKTNEGAGEGHDEE